MLSIHNTIRLGLAVLLWASIPGLVNGSDFPYEEYHRPGRWRLFGGVDYDTPQEQLEHARTLEKKGHLRSATSAYKALVNEWPDATQSPEAQLACARLLEERGHWYDAFDEYTHLLERYAGQVPYEEVLDHQFNIAVLIMNHRRGKCLLFPGVSAPERAVPLFETILKYGPQWQRAAEVQFLIGQAYDLSKQYELAIDAYTETQYRYPLSDFAEKAAFARASDLYMLSKRTPNDDQLSEAAWAALTLYVNTYPRSDHMAEATEYRKALYRRRAKMAFDEAAFYERIARKPAAALLAYQRFLQRFPHSGWTTLAEIRIQELEAKLENSSHD